MAFVLDKYTAPDFDSEPFRAAPSARFLPAPMHGVAPDGYHAMSVFPEYFKVDGRWLLAEESRMDCMPVLGEGRIHVVEARRLQKGDPVACGRTEDGSEGIYLHAHGFEAPPEDRQAFAFRQGHSRESSFSRDYDELYDLLRHEREHGKIVWVMGPAFAFDYDARDAFSRIIAGGMFTPCWRATPWPPMTWRAPTWVPPWGRTSIPENICGTATTITWIR